MKIILLLGILLFSSCAAPQMEPIVCIDEFRGPMTEKQFNVFINDLKKEVDKNGRLDH